jgi:hypothetical protein
MRGMQWATRSLSAGILLQARELKQDRRTIHLAEVSCKRFTELTQQEQDIILAWLQGYNLPEHEPAVIDLEKLLLDRAKVADHCINKPEDAVMTAAEAMLATKTCQSALVRQSTFFGALIWLLRPAERPCLTYGQARLRGPAVA